MNGAKNKLVLLSMAVGLLGPAARAGHSQPPGAVSKAPAWQTPSAEDIKGQALAWLEGKTADEATRAKAAAVWLNIPQRPAGGELLSRLGATFALVDPGAAKLVEL
ncbi:unnamed protein product, partial [marine sediment metagenome]